MKVIKDDYGNDYEVSDMEAFKQHIKLYHSKNGKGDFVLLISEANSCTRTQNPFSSK